MMLGQVSRRKLGVGKTAAISESPSRENWALGSSMDAQENARPANGAQPSAFPATGSGD